jgi:hypothetical protein
MAMCAASRAWLAAVALSTIAGVVGPVGLAAAAPGDFPYCAASRGYEENYMNCSFATFDGCLEELKGMRGYCVPNPYYVGPPPVPARPAAKPPRPHSRD